MKLHERFSKQGGEKAASFAKCVGKMQATGIYIFILSGVRTRVDNRGGLLVVSDEAYHLFVAIEYCKGHYPLI
jgi:hypothetical protein